MNNNPKEKFNNFKIKFTIIYIISFLILLFVSGLFITNGSKSIFIMLFIGIYLFIAYYAFEEYKKIEYHELPNEKNVNITNYEQVKEMIKKLPFGIVSPLYKDDINYENYVSSILVSLKQRGFISIEHDAIVVKDGNGPLEDNEKYLLDNITKIYSSITLRGEWKLKIYNDLVKYQVATYKSLKNHHFITLAVTILSILFIEIIIALIFHNTFASGVLIPSFIFSIIILLVCRETKDIDDPHKLENIKLKDIDLSVKGKDIHNILNGLNRYLASLNEQSVINLININKELIPYIVLFGLCDDVTKAEVEMMKELSLNKQKFDSRKF